MVAYVHIEYSTYQKNRRGGGTTPPLGPCGIEKSVVLRGLKDYHVVVVYHVTIVAIGHGLLKKFGLWYQAKISSNHQIRVCITVKSKTAIEKETLVKKTILMTMVVIFRMYCTLVLICIRETGIFECLFQIMI